MDTFHIRPETDLAPQAVEIIRKIVRENPTAWIAVRGKESYDGKKRWLCDVDSRPDQDNPRECAWSYHRAINWLERYEKHWG